MISESAALESLENLLEQKFLGLTPDPLNQKLWGWVKRSVFQQLLQVALP